MALDPVRIEERLDKVAIGGTPISMAFGGVKFQTMLELLEFSKLMALSGVAVPPHLRNNPGAALAICTKALRFNFDPFSLAEHSYTMAKNQKVGDRWETVETIAYDSYVLRAVIEAHAPIKGQLAYAFEGEGENLKCTVSAVLRDGGERRSHTSLPLGERVKSIGRNEKGNLKGSPLWESKPSVQLAYDTARDFCRIYFPQVLMGWYDKDEFDEHVRAEKAENITPKPDIASRLKGSTGRGFSKDHVDAHTAPAIENKPGEVVQTPVGVPETIGAVVSANDGMAKPEDAVIVTNQGPPYTGEPTPAGPPKRAKKSTPKPPETPLDRAKRLLAMCRTREDVDNVLHSVGEELAAEDDLAALKALGAARAKEL